MEEELRVANASTTCSTGYSNKKQEREACDEGSELQS